MNFKDTFNQFDIKGHIKIFDPITNEILCNKRNAIHYEHLSIALAESLANAGNGFIHEMSFGNGGTSIDPTGIITYLTPNVNTLDSGLYNQTYTKVINSSSSSNIDPLRNKVEVRHLPGMTYTDIFATCLLDYGEPQDQEALDSSDSVDGQYVFDELGLRSFDLNGNGRLLTHVIFHPIQKSLNRLIQIEYTVRIQSLANLLES